MSAGAPVLASGRTSSAATAARAAWALRAAAAAALLAGLAACWTEPRRPQASGSPVPGTLWITPAQPWRVGVLPSRIAAAGSTALLASSVGWIARFDLERGRLMRERWLEGFQIEQLLALPRGGWLLVGVHGRRSIAAAIEPATLEPRIVVEGGERAEPDPSELLQDPARAAVLDEGVALAVDGLPLAIYDPATWQVRRVVDPALGWRWVAGAGKALYAVGPGGLARFDLAAGAGAATREATREAMEAPRYRAGATEHYLVTRDHAGQRWAFGVVGRDRKARLAAGERAIAIDPARDRIAVRDAGVVHVYSLADGARVGAYPLGDSGHGFFSAMTFDRGRLIVAIGTVVRVIDLATGAITPAGEPPYGSGALAVTDAGEVLLDGLLGTQVVRARDGKLLSVSPVGRNEVAITAPHQAARYGVYGLGDGRRVELREPGGSAPLGAWGAGDTIRAAWLGAAGVVIDIDGIQVQRTLYRTAGAYLEPITPIKLDAWVLDVDLDGGQALVSVESTAYLVRLRQPAIVRELPLPGCERYASAELERGGDRLLLNPGAELAVYRRSTGARIGAARIEEAATGAIVFVPGRDELLIAGRDALVLWNPLTGAVRRRGGIPGLAHVQVAPGARLAAISFHDGRLALVELDALRAAMTPGRAEPMSAEMDRRDCPGGDPFELDAAPEPEALPEPVPDP